MFEFLRNLLRIVTAIICIIFVVWGGWLLLDDMVLSSFRINDNPVVAAFAAIAFTSVFWVPILVWIFFKGGLAYLFGAEAADRDLLAIFDGGMYLFWAVIVFWVLFLWSEFS